MITYLFYGMVVAIIVYVARDLYVASWRDFEFGDDDYDGGI